MRYLPTWLAFVALTIVACGGSAADDDDDDDEGNADEPDATPLVDAPLPPGPGVALDIGNGGGAYDIYEADVVALFEADGATVTTLTTQEADLVDDVGLLLVLSPTSGFPDAAPAQALLARGGTVVVVTEHSGYGDHVGATAYLAQLGTTLASVGGLRTGTQALTVEDVGWPTDGVGALSLFYGAEITLGADGVAIASYDDGAPAIATQQVGPGHVVLVPDGSLFGYVLDSADNAQLLRNLRP